ncbi:MAG: SRPBCC family protein [Actinobacteria bacterium]|nr:MAG: SRPBCC family protein [Actinomycetota bacterium]
MDVTATVDAPVGVEKLFAVVEDLATYPQWLTIVHQVTVEPIGSDGCSAWLVELRGKVGPFARSKRLRMVRCVCESPNTVIFERRETDGRKHSPWVLTAQVEASSVGSSLTVHLHYGGTLFTGGVLERLLADQIVQGREKLLLTLNMSH